MKSIFKLVFVKFWMFLALFGASNSHAGIPVIDGSNLAQTVMSAVENVAQTLKQIEQYKTQLQQYENMIQNTAAPSSHVWDSALTTMTNLRSSIDTLNHYKASLGSIDGYLGKFKDTAGYSTSQCFQASGCSATERAALNDGQRFGSEAQKRANDAALRGLDRQQDAMVNDARQLERLQGNAQGATGQMQALGYASQLASQQANQLLQIRGLLVAQQNAILTRNQAIADREAQQAASAEQLRKGAFRASTAVGW